MEGNPNIWKILKEACRIDPSSAEQLLASNNIKICNNLQICVDQKGFLYKLPVSVIQEPKEFTEDIDISKIPKPKSSTLIQVLLADNIEASERYRRIKIRNR